jgi:hypothetical protein
MIDLVQVSREHKGSAKWLESALERVRNMAARWGTGADGLVNEVWKAFAASSPALGLWVGIQDDEIVGHALADIRFYDGTPVVWVLQVETDIVVGRAYRDFILKTIDDWGLAASKAMNLTVIDSLMSTPRINDAWARHSGYEPYRVIHRRRIPKRAE